MKYSIVIPVTERDNKFLKRCVLSIEDQDYEDKEIVVVGYKNGKAKRVCKDLGVPYYEAKSDGASAKRNLGADKTDGEILFFFDVDCILLSGILGMVKDAFEDNPDCSFVYGAYRFLSKDLKVYPSMKFDPYLLETMNYICTMSPMKREIFPRFREELEYFQDWDLFLRIAKDGHKGFYFEDVMFNTEEPDAKSISGRSKLSFMDRLKHIRKINNIEEKPICVCSLGAPYQSLQRAKLLGADYLGRHQNSNMCQIPSMFENEYKMIYVMGFYPLNINDHANIFTNCKKDCLKVVQWIGTDVFQLRTRFNWEQLKFIRDKILSHIDIHLCNSEFLEKELREIGIDAERIYMPLIQKPHLMPFPEKFTVGVYYSDSNPMHNEEFLLDIAKSMPDIDFKFFGGSKRAVEDNIEYMEWKNIEEVIKQCSINIRISVHDGFPHTPIQFLMAGREVITNFEMPHTHYIPMQVDNESYGEDKVKLMKKIREVKSGLKKKIDKKAMTYYNAITDPQKYKMLIEGLLKRGKKNVD